MTEETIALTAKELKIIEKEADALFKHLGIDAKFEVASQESIVEILLDSPDNGIIIGYHGEILEALQLILSLIVSKKIGRFVRVSVEVGDYKKNRTAYLERLAEQVKERALSEGKEQTIPSLKSWERRIVHVFLQDDEEVVSESAGEGRDRVLVVKPKV